MPQSTPPLLTDSFHCRPKASRGDVVASAVMWIMHAIADELAGADLKAEPGPEDSPQGPEVRALPKF